MYKKMIIILLLLNSTVLFAALFGDDKEEVILPTHIFQINGEEYFDASDMYEAIGVDHKSKFEFWKDDTARIKDKLLPTLHASLRAFYDSEGFYAATYTIKESKTTVNVNVVENEPVKVEDINISSDYDLSTLVSFKKGEVFKAKEFINIKGKIAAQLLKDGYCSYELDTKAYVDLVKHSVDLHYVLKKGGVCTFGNTTITGTKSIKDERVILSRVRAKEGERFSTELIKDTSDALYGLQALDSVLVGTDRKFYNVVPVDIVVKEMEKPYQFEAGAGYDTYVGARVHATLTKHNFLNNAQRLKLQLQWSQLDQLAILSFYRPVLFSISEYYVGLGASLGYSNLGYPGFQEEKGFFKLYLDHLSERTTLRVGIVSELINITAKELREGEELKYSVNEGEFFLTYPFVDFTYDGRDSKLNPKYGYFFRFYTEMGLSDSEDSSIYNKTLLEGRLIYTFGELTLATVGVMGAVEEQTRQSLPESKYFFAGGVMSNRAYGFRELGVILSPTVDTIFGAASWANLSLEADYPVWGDLYGAVFTDNTMLTPDAYDFSGEVITSAGVGVRYMTPIGPFKVDVGMNVQDISQYAISFQIGQSF
jgi:translocation and assembly module TamA